MDWYNISPHNNGRVNFTSRHSLDAEDLESARKDRSIGGILRNVALGWLAENCTLRVLSLQKDETLSSYTFCRSTYNCAGIICVEEVTATDSPHNTLLAVCLDSHQVRDHGDATANYSVIAIYSVVHNCVLSCFQLPLYVTSMRFMNAENCRRSLLQSFDGCLAVGTQEGQILVIDLYLKNLFKIYEKRQNQLITSNVNITDCKIVDFDLPPADIRRCYQKCLRELNAESVVHFALRIEVVDSTCAVESLLPIHLITGLAAGLEDGRLVLYDLIELQIFYVHKKEHNQMPLVKMDFLEPPDDPRPCLYILALYDNGEELIGELHDLMYEKRAIDNFGCYFENFLRGSKKLILPMENSVSSVISCQAISRLPSNFDNEDATSLFVISWYSALEKLNKILVFDINQWYKEEMPSQVNIRRAVCYLAAFQLKGSQSGLAVYINPATIANFDSLQRCEEHFYPNSLSFDCILISSEACLLYKWPGIQSKILNSLREKNATLFLEPDAFFEDVRRCRLLPQFTELNVDATFSKTAMCEALLGVALEYNCIGLLLDCVRSWADGSFSGNHGWQAVNSELSLRFLINWIWKRAADIETRCNELCKGLLNTVVSCPLDHRCKKELGAITCQLKHLADLMDAIVKQQIQRRTLDDELINSTKHESLRLAADFRQLLIWLINIGVLPENMQIQDDNKPTTSRTVVPMVTSSIYPYKRIRDFYVHKRATYANINENCIKKSGSCRYIFIDAFMEHECMQRTLGDNHGVEGCNTLREYWQEDGGNGLYPPTTIVSMLRIMLLPNISYESKCSVLLYFFLDLHVALNDTDSDGIKDITNNLLKYSSVFKLPQHIVKNVQGFWHLDHGNFLAAVDEFSSPFTNTQNYDQWLIELQVESLLIQNAAHLAIRVLDAHPSLIAPTLKLKILLSNNLIAEAFHFARSKDDDELMQLFFISCLKMGNLSVVRDLALNEREGQLVERLLKSSQFPGAENLHFVYLLQKSKYIEAVSYMDELSTGKCLRSSGNDAIDAPDLVSSAMNTMPPITQRSTDVYFRIKNKIKQRETCNRTPVPLSCQLIKQNANNLLGGIYHSSALSAHFASCYFDDELRHGKQQQAVTINPLSARNAPFLRKPQTETHSEVVDQLTRQNICYPKEYELVQRKRKHDEFESIDCRPQKQQDQQQQQPSKRLRVDFEAVVSDLKRFQEKNLTLKDAGFNITMSETAAKPAKESFTKMALINSQNEQTEHDTVAPLRQSSSNGLQGILKLCTPEPTTPRKLKRGESPAIEEKTLRFTLPPSDNSEVLNETINFETKEPQIIHKGVTRTLSEESLASGADEEVCAETTKYYSVLQTPPKTTNSSISLPSAVTVKDSGISMTSKPLTAHNSNTSSLYETAIVQSDRPNNFGPIPRRPLTRASVEPDTQLRQTGINSSLNKVSSGFCEEGSQVESSMITTEKTTALEITTVATLTSGDFAPRICSSKVGDMKFSERSTVPMLAGESLRELEHGSRTSVSVSTHYEKHKVTELDTTLGMSSIDLTPYEENIAEEAFITAQIQADNLPEVVEPMEIESEANSRASIESQASDSRDPTIESQSDVSQAQSESEEEETDITEDNIGSEVVELLSSTDGEDELDNIEIETDEEENEIVNYEELEEEDEYDESDMEAEDEQQYVADDSYDAQIESDDDEPELGSDESVVNNSNNEVIGADGVNVNVSPKQLKQTLGSPAEDINLVLDDDENSNEEPSNYQSKKQKESDAIVEVQVTSSSGEDKSDFKIELSQFEVKCSDSNVEQSEQVREPNSAENIESFRKQTTVESAMVIKDFVTKSSQFEGVSIIETTVKMNTFEITVEEPQVKDKSNSMAVSDNIEHKIELADKSVSDKLSQQIDETTNTSKAKSMPDNIEHKVELADKSFTDKLSQQIDETTNTSKAKPMPDNIEHKIALADKSVSDKLSQQIDETTNTSKAKSMPDNIEHKIELADKSVSDKLSQQIDVTTKTSKAKSMPDNIEQKIEIANIDKTVSDKLSQQIDETANTSKAKSSEDAATSKLKKEKNLFVVLERIENSRSKTEAEIKKVKEGSTDQVSTKTNDPETIAENFETPVVEENIDSANVSGNSEPAIVNISTSAIDDTLVNAPSSKQAQNVQTLLEDNAKSKDAFKTLEKALETPSKEKKTANVTGSTSSFESPQSSKLVQNLRTLKTKDSDISTLRSTPRNRKRGQSMPPQSVLAVEIEHIETDSHTSKRRSTRGISVPPQAIDSSTSSKLNEVLPMTPKTRSRYATRASLNVTPAIAESIDSQHSPQSSRSGRSSHMKRLQMEHTSGTPILDSPALRTRSRLRTVSETGGDGEGSDITQASTPSVSANVRKRRRPSISNKSDAIEDKDTTASQRYTGRRIFLKDEDEEDGTSSSVQASYVEARRLTRTQRRLLDDQVSVSSQTTQGSTKLGGAGRSVSVKSHDDDDDNDDVASVTSSVGSELRRSNRLLRSQQQHSSNPSLTAIPERDDAEEGSKLSTKRTRAAKK